jgi:hypothetical protein
MAGELTILKENADQLLLAELAVFFHNIGKCSEEFIEHWSRESKDSPKIESEKFFEQYVTGSLLRLSNAVTDKSPSLKAKCNHANSVPTQKLISENDKNKIFWDLIISLPSPFDDRPAKNKSEINWQEHYRFGFFVEFHKKFIDLPNDNNPNYNDHKMAEIMGSAYRALAVCHLSHHLASKEEKEPSFLPIGYNLDHNRQTNQATYVDSAYGFPLGSIFVFNSQLNQSRETLIKKLCELSDKASLDAEYYQNIMQLSQDCFEKALGETRRPLNDIRLWDLSHSTASFFKSGLAGLIGAGRTKEDLAAADVYKTLQWSYLTISVDFFQFAASAQKIIDIIARRDKLNACYSAVKELMETIYPIANQIYCDEYGPVYLIPSVDILNWDDGRENLKEKIMQCFRVPAHSDNEKENIKEKVIDAIPAFPATEHIIEAGVEKETYLQQAIDLKQRRPLNSASPKEVQELWNRLRNNSDPKKQYAEVCPVCGIRPVGFDDGANYNDTAKDRKVCAVCLNRRSGRARRWRLDRTLHTTVWIEEASDENGRAALVCGKFDLTNWLNGKHIKTIKKNPSFSRIQRCWETTRRFWQEIQQTNILAQLFVEQRPRLVVHTDERLPNDKIGPYQACELWFDPASISAVVCDRDPGLFVTTDNLLAVADSLPGLGNEARKKIKQAKNNVPGSQKEIALLLQEHINKFSSLRLSLPGHYGETRKELGDIAVKKVEIEHSENGYYPFIPILCEPATFMTIVPANRALVLAELIKAKYAKEMAKVRDRLPLHLSVVFFPKYVPAGAVLDAGRRLLANASTFKEDDWQIQNKIFHNSVGLPVADADQAWEVVLNLHHPESQRCKEIRLALRQNPEENDPERKWDKIHSQLLLAKNEKADIPETIWAAEATDQKIRFSPSTFDYVFLDTASRRFESALDEKKHRRFHPLLGIEHSPRPYDLEAIHNFRELWSIIKGTPALSTNKLYGIRDLLAKKIQDWHVFEQPEDNEAQGAYDALVIDVLNKEFGYHCTNSFFTKMKSAMLDGSFFDCLDLYLHILKEDLST